MPKHERALAFFPSFYDARQPNGVLYQVAQRLAEPLEHADSSLFRIQRAHRLLVAEDLGDLVRLAAALNLSTRHFDDILSEAPVEMGEDVGTFRQRLIDAYASRLNAVRQRVQRVARLHLEGLGTPWAMLEGAAIFLGAEMSDTGVGAVHHEDEGGFSHWSNIRFARAAGAPRARVYLHENPLRVRKASVAERYPRNRWEEVAQHVAVAPARIVIAGVGDRTVLPSVYCSSTGEGIAFNGIIPEGSTLIIDDAGGAMLDGHPADDFVSFDTGGRFDIGGRIDPPSGAIGRFIVERDGPRALFAGDRADLATGPRIRRTNVPAVPPGPSEWVFTVAIGVCDVSLTDFAVFETPDEPVGLYGNPPRSDKSVFEPTSFDASVFDYPPSARAGIGWDERIPCAVKLLVPPSLPLPTQPGAEQAWVPTDLGRISALLERVRPAGVRVWIDVARDDWILGESVIRDRPAEGAGDRIDRNTTAVYAPGTDRFIPLDPATLNA